MPKTSEKTFYSYFKENMDALGLPAPASLFGTLTAAYYVGACIGSLAVATGKYLSGGLSILDCINTANEYGFQAHWLGNFLNRNPNAIKPGKKIRHFFTPSQFTFVPAR